MLEQDAGYAVADDAKDADALDYLKEEKLRFRILEREALAVYHDHIKHTLTDADQDKWLIINTESRDYEIVSTEAEGLQRFTGYGRHAPIYLMPIGEPEPILMRGFLPGDET